MKLREAIEKQMHEAYEREERRIRKENMELKRYPNGKYSDHLKSKFNRVDEIEDKIDELRNVYEFYKTSKKKNSPYKIYKLHEILLGLHSLIDIENSIIADEKESYFIESREIFKNNVELCRLILIDLGIELSSHYIDKQEDK